jgi:signal transduction histidine kinase
MTIRGDTLLEYGKEQGLVSNVAFCFHEDSNGDIWAGTKEGLTRISPSGITTFTSADGLADNQIFQLVEDEFGFFWIGCNKGIMRVQREELLQRARGKLDKVACAIYNRSDGTSSNRTNAPAAACRTSDGRIWFPTDRGVTIVEPKNFRLNSSVPSVFVPQIFVDGASIVPGSGNINFEANVQRLEFHYTALSFFAPEKVLFKYRLEGYDNEWIDAGSRRVAYYTSLPRGREYRFRVIACNNDGIWNEEGATIAFYLKPYWYETSWFYAACGLIIIGGAFGLYRRRVHAIETRAMALEETVRLRTAELQAANAEISRRMEIQSEQAHQIESANKDLQTTNAQLDEANRLKTQLLSMAAHDLKNPLSAIIGLSEIALTDIPKHTTSWEMLGHIQTTAERMGLLIKDLLDAATIELGNIALHRSNVALPLLAHSIADRYQLNAEQKKQRIEVETEEEIIVSADAARLEQVFDNLISNAVKYSPQGKTIHLRVKKNSSNARIEVQDEGPGISAEDQKQLFGFFQRLSARPTGGESSNGVGLAIVRKIVDLHGGNIWVQSELGKGATFIMELPLV